MAKRNQDMTIGGQDGSFRTTPWTLIKEAQTRDRDRRKAVLDGIMRRYWRPVYCYLRRKGYTVEPANDLTQGFFEEIVLGKELIQRSDQAKGRFRTFLLTALNNYLIDVGRARNAKKRLPKHGLVPLEIVASRDLPETGWSDTPPFVLIRVYTTEFLDKVLAEVKNHYYDIGKATHWEVFRTRILDPILNNTDPPSLAKICRKYIIKDEKTAANMVGSVKRRFRHVLRRQLRKSVRSDSDVEDEIRDLIDIFSRGHAE